MATRETDLLASTTLSDAERRAVERLVALLREQLGAGLREVWLYGSRARGEPAHPDSDVDLVVLTDRGRGDRNTVYGLMAEAAEAEGLFPHYFSIRVGDLAWLEDRRRIRSFFIEEVDRDKIVIHGGEE